MKRFMVALGCLTILPCGAHQATDERDLGASFAYFPLIGLLIGGLLYIAYYHAYAVLSRPVASALAVLVWVVITGALHVDGVGDVCDACYAGHTPVQRLRIMKDPHVGAMAVVGIGMLLLLKYAVIVSLGSAMILPALLLTPMLGRYAMVILGTTMPYARIEGGTAAAFVRTSSWQSLIGSSLTVVVGAVLLWRVRGLILVAVTVVLSMIFRAAYQRLLGGVTGDAFGAAGECTEVCLLIGVLSMSS